MFAAYFARRRAAARDARIRKLEIREAGLIKSGNLQAEIINAASSVWTFQTDQLVDVRRELAEVQCELKFLYRDRGDAV